MWLWQREGEVGGHGVIHTGPRPTAAEDWANERVPGTRRAGKGARQRWRDTPVCGISGRGTTAQTGGISSCLLQPAWLRMNSSAQAFQRYQDRFLPLYPQKRWAPPRAGQIQMKALSALPKLAIQLGEAQRSTDRWNAGVTLKHRPCSKSFFLYSF